MSREKEIRTLTMPVEVRADEESGTNYIVGYALKFNSESNDLGGFVEIIEPGALDGADMSDVRALFNHSADKVLARSKSGTLKLEVDEIGLKYTIAPPDTTYARDLMESMQRKDIDQSSFAFTLNWMEGDDDIEYDEARDIYIRTIKKFRKIWDVSVVTYPAYEKTESVVGQRSLDNYKNEVAKQLKKRQIALELDLI
ncbi:HK97 family phage prohead protease [Pseudalkalibacillus sp. JSM 102089]|uniref:HK97 family phage prohead protease n=1 Tax=Pseudalkalibacillus sp. JSM 102089 TaxID=3229856 RepID=UPI0035234526